MKGGGWKRKKTYGEYKVATCPFCERMATQETEEGLPVCHKHLDGKLEAIKCTCGKWLEQRAGKFGPYFSCLDCGNFNYRKAMEIKEITMGHQKPSSSTYAAPATRRQEKSSAQPTSSYASSRPYTKPKPKETTISSRDAQYFD